MLTGYVTRAASAYNFEANGLRVLCGAETLTLKEVRPAVDDTNNGCPRAAPYIGEVVTVYGSLKKKKHAVEATRIEFPLPVLAGMRGSAVVEALNEPDPPDPQPTQALVRADGYWIRIYSKTRLNLVPPLQSLTDVKPGNWLDYKGTLGADGVVVATEARIGPNFIGAGEEKLRAKNEFDPSATPSDTKKNAIEHALIGGFDRTEFPPYKDPAMQARVNAVGEKLIPTFERNLPNSDPAKIHFRFQVVDNTGHRDVWALPSGIILIPRQVVERMQNDSQLATVLADSIACALERQQYRTQAAGRLAATASWGGFATVAAGGLVPIAGDAILAGSMETQSDIAAYRLEQRGRVSLGLLHDAGYDIDQAPIAWWLLASRKPRPLAKIDLPDQAAYLYLELGETWDNPLATPGTY